MWNFLASGGGRKKANSPVLHFNFFRGYRRLNWLSITNVNPLEPRTSGERNHRTILYSLLDNISIKEISVPNGRYILMVLISTNSC